MMDADRLNALTAALVALAQAGIPTDIQELLVSGNARQGIAPGALAAAIRAAEPAPVGGPIRLTYRNWRGEVSDRKITPKSVWFGATDWHPEPQWLLRAYDHDKQADRDFALADFGASPARPED